MKLLFCFLLASFPGVPSSADDTLTVTLCYERLCPYSIDFIANQLSAAWEKFKGRAHFELVPFGNAIQKYQAGQWVFTCQHGDNECLLNKYDACAIHLTCGNPDTSRCNGNSMDRLMKFIFCDVDQEDPVEATKQCATSAGIDYDSLKECATGALGQNLLHGYGDRTAELHIDGTPFVAFNGKNDPAAENNLSQEICKQRPHWCKVPGPTTSASVS